MRPWLRVALVQTASGVAALWLFWKAIQIGAPIDDYDIAAAIVEPWFYTGAIASAIHVFSFCATARFVLLRFAPWRLLVVAAFAEMSVFVQDRYDLYLYSNTFGFMALVTLAFAMTVQFFLDRHGTSARRISEEGVKKTNKAAEPSATDNPGDAQRLREDH